MRRTFIFIIATLFLLSTISALSLQVEKISSNEVMVEGLNKPVTFDLRITNNGANESIDFYSLVGFQIYPAGKTQILSEETKDIKLEVYPVGEFDYLGNYKFPYYIRGKSGEMEGSLMFLRIKFPQAFKVSTEDISPDSKSTIVTITNTENFNFGNTKVTFSSPFYETEKSFTLGPKEKRNFTIDLNKEKYLGLEARFYTLTTEIAVDNQKAKYETTINYIEKELIKTTESSNGLIINTKTIQKINEGNIVGKSDVTLGKNIITRLFTTFSPEPDIVERRGFNIYYTWNKEINPGERLDISVKTNYTFPLIIVLLIVAIVILVKLYTRSNLVLRKQVTFVRAKGGEFALKVSIFVNAKTFIEKVNIIDRLPPLVKLYEKFGVERPSKFDSKMRRLEWAFPSLQAEETRVLSYIIYSKVGILGKFALPSTMGMYEKDGDLHETESNRAYFVAEQRLKDLDERD